MKTSKETPSKTSFIFAWVCVILAAISLIGLSISHIKKGSDVRKYMQEADSTEIDYFGGDKHFRVYTPDYLFSITYAPSVRFQQEAETTAIIYDTTGHMIVYMTDVDSIKKVVATYFAVKHR